MYRMQRSALLGLLLLTSRAANKRFLKNIQCALQTNFVRTKNLGMHYSVNLLNKSKFKTIYEERERLSKNPPQNGWGPQLLPGRAGSWVRAGSSPGTPSAWPPPPGCWPPPGPRPAPLRHRAAQQNHNINSSWPSPCPSPPPCCTTTTTRQQS